MATFISLSLTIGIDSVMWKEFWLWPEGKVLYYNVILNQSSNWGTSPWIWYFKMAIPKAMCSSLLLVPIGVYLDRRTVQLVLPSLIFVFLYSFLPHKELRFIIYVFPLLNVAAAETCKRWEENMIQKPTSIWRKTLYFGAVMHILLNSCYSMGMLYISSQNYPGGDAILKIHQLENDNVDNSITSTSSSDTIVNLHICNYAAQTGVSRFTQLNDNWIYNKTEKLSPEDFVFFSHLLVESSDAESMSYLINTHQIIGEVMAYRDFSMDLRKFPPVRINFKSAVTIFKKISTTQHIIIPNDE